MFFQVDGEDLKECETRIGEILDEIEELEEEVDETEQQQPQVKSLMQFLRKLTVCVHIFE